MTLDCAQFLNNPPSEGWYKLTGCVASVPDAAYETYGHKGETVDPKDVSINKVWMPLFAIDDTNLKKSLEDKTSVLLKTESPEIIETEKELLALDATEKDEKKVLEWMDKHRDQLILKQDFEGMVEAGMSLSESEHRQISELQDTSLTPNFVVLEEGARPPAPIAAVGEILLGVLCGLAALAVGITEIARVISWFRPRNR